MTTAAPARLDVFGWLADRTGCGTIRIQLPLTALREHGIRTGWSERLYEHRMPRTLIGQRVCLPGPSEMWQRLAKRPDRPKLVYEIDDNLWDIDHGSERAAKFFGDPAVRANLDANIRAADAVTVTTEPLADLVRPLNPNVHVVPNYLPAWLLEHQRPRRDGRVVIGWGGSATHRMDWSVCGPQVRRYLQRAPRHVEFHVMGADYTAEARIPRDRVRVTDWTNSVPDYWRAIDYSIMLAPLRPHPFNRSKSPLRVLEAAILGIPVIASDYGPYADFVEHGVTGLLARTDHDWGRHLRALVEDQAMREEMGAAARAKAAGWTIEANTSQWEKVLTA
jgi:glycosyltransferase involved in cell wall biosynthesis